MGNEAEFDAMYEQLFGDDPAPIPPSIPKRVLNALSTATCGRCRGGMKRSMAGWVHDKSGNDLCGPRWPGQVGMPIVDEENER